MNRHAHLAGLGLGAVLLAGCCHLAMDSRPLPCQPLPDTLAAEVSVPKPDGFRVREISLQTNRAIILRRLELILPPESSGANNIIALDCFQPEHPNFPLPVVLVMAVSGGSYEIEHHVARYFARHDFAAIVIRRPGSDRSLTTGEQVNVLLRRSIQNDVRVVDWVATRPEFDAQRLGVFAISLGAIQGATFAAVDSRVRAAALGLVGGDVADILAHTRKGDYVKRRDALLRTQHLTLAELQQQFADAIQCDPIYFAPYAEREKFMLVLAVFDHVVPFQNGWELRQKMGKPETILLPVGHLTALLYLPYMECQALDFYRRCFEAGRPATQCKNGFHRGCPGLDQRKNISAAASAKRKPWCVR